MYMHMQMTQFVAKALPIDKFDGKSHNCNEKQHDLFYTLI